MLRFISRRISLGIFFMLFTAFAQAEAGYVHVTDMSKVHYQLMGDGKVYLRNLHSFRTGVTGCCYAFVLDTTTPYGKSAWSVILMKMASKSPLSLYVTDFNPPTSGAPAKITNLGNW